MLFYNFCNDQIAHTLLLTHNGVKKDSPVCAERDSLKGKVRDYERVRRAIGPEQADKILEAVYQQEQAEKERKRAARPKMRVGAR